ncbi:MAG: peptidase M20 [Rhodospirillales bacterium 20-60-12]|nr:MAG: peptidase M20 [Rhodospirillales bacterium 20-60-12]HQT68049.1 M20 aminoacylase family protein [Acetobacteraceae bacterium]
MNQIIKALAPELTAWRRDFHAHPELSFHEHRTSDIVAAKLESWGIEVTRNIAGTGLVGTLRAGGGNRAIAIRADMDALPIQEASQTDYVSQNPGVMHACGHDGHTTMLLGAAKYLSESRSFSGIVHFIFQPAEENGGGAEVMIREGLFERFPADSVFGAHNDPSLPLGEISISDGTVNAAADTLTINLTGKGGHAARPQCCVDPVVAGCQIVLALQSMVARRTDPQDSAVLSITQFHAGSADNIIPQTAMLNGTVRTLLPRMQNWMEATIPGLIMSVAEAYGVTAEVIYERGYPPVINDAAASARAALAAGRVASQVHRDLPPSMGAEDFSYMASAVPGCFVRIGQRQGDKGGVGLHHPLYDFNDEALPIGASLWAALVEQELPL